jgi:uncharacterized protein
MKSPAAADRIVTLDILRGIALFGMILVHFHQNMELPAKGREDLVGWVIWMGAETKSWATFAFLFGAGFAILMRRAEARGLRVVPLFLRRMFALAVIGIAVQLLFGFRILLDYAIWGVPLLLIRNWSTRSLLIIAFLSAISLSVYTTVVKPDRKAYAAIRTALQDAEEHGTFIDAVKARVADARYWYLRPRVFVPDTNIVLFIFGLLAVRHGIFDDPKRHKRTILTMMTFGFVSWAAYWIGSLKFEWENGYGIVLDQWLAFTYIGAVILLLAYRPKWKERLAVFGAAGRMALTSYVLQAALLSILASGYGFALRIRPYYDLPATVFLFAILATFSMAWLSRYRYGPLERVWRWFTYAEWSSAR